jgi:nitrate reductase NapE component
MTTLVLAYAQQDAALGSRLEKDLQAKGWTIQPELAPDPDPHTGNILIIFVSPASNADQMVQATLIDGLDRLLQIIPVQLGGAPIPKLIDHLQMVNFADGYPLDALVERIKIATSPNAPRPLKVLTPTRKRNNRGVATWLAILAVIWFIIGVVLVGFYGIQAPTEEYNSVDTEVAATIQEYVRANLPHSTEEAVNFPATVQAAPTGQQPLLIATATAMAAPK